MPILTLDQNSFLGGMSLSDFFANGGFSPNSIGFEVDRGSQLGLLLPGRDITSYTTAGGVTLSGNVLTSCANSAGALYYLITSTGNVYKTLTSPGLIAHTLEDTGLGTPDHSIVYDNSVFVSLNGDIAMYSLDFTTKNKTWWTATMGQAALNLNVPHKFFIFQGVLYMTNGNTLISFDGTTANSGALVLPTGWVITDALVDGANIYFVASYLLTTGSWDYNAQTKIFDWNSFDPNKWQAEIDIYTGPIRSMVKVDVVGQRRSVFMLFSTNAMYMVSEFYGTFTCTWLRSLPSYGPNYNQITINGGLIYFVTKNGIAKYNTHFNILTVPVAYNTASITALNMGYLDYIDFFTSDGNFYRSSVNNSLNAPAPNFYSNWVDFQNSRINKIVVAFGSALASGSQFTLKIYDERNQNIYSRVMSYANDGAKTEINITNVSPNLPVNLAQIRLSFDYVATPGIRFIKVFYTPSEMYVTR